MRVFCLLAFFAALCGAAEDKPKGDAVKEELAKLQGAWYIAEIQFEGRTIAWMDLAQDSMILIKGNRFETAIPSRGVSVRAFAQVGDGPKKTEALRPVLKQICTERDFITVNKGDRLTTVAIEVDPAAKPKQLDVKVERGSVEGVYILDGDVATICVAVPGKARPKEIKPENGVFLKLVREKAKSTLDEARKQAMQDELKKLQGTWNVVEGEYDAARLTDKDLKDFQLVIEEDRLTWKEAGVSETLKVQTDSAARPSLAIDLIPTQGPRKNQPLRGIYQLEKDRLILRLAWNHAFYRAKSIDIQKKDDDTWASHDARLVLKR